MIRTFGAESCNSGASHWQEVKLGRAQNVRSGVPEFMLVQVGGVRDAVVLLDRCLFRIADSRGRGVKRHGDLGTQDLVYFILWLDRPQICESTYSKV